MCSATIIQFFAVVVEVIWYRF